MRLSAVIALLTAQVLCADAVEVSCTTLSLGLDESRRGTVSRVMTKGGGNLSAESRADLFELSFFRAAMPTDTVTVVSGKAKSFSVERLERGVRLVYGDWDRACTRVVCDIFTRDAADDRIRWRIDVTPEPGWELEKTCYPCIKLSDTFAETIVLGTTKGGVLTEPRKMNRWGSAKAKFPGQLAAQFGCIYGQGRLFHFGAEDAIGVPKEIVFRRDPDAFLALWRRYSAAGEGTRVAYDVVTAGADGKDVDWRDAADLHRAWALTQPFCRTRFADRKDIPAWMKEAPALVRFGRRELNYPEEICAWFDTVWRKRYPGIPLITAFWGWEKVSTWVSPDYFPFHPSDDEFARIVAAAKAAGGHVFLWPSGYHWAVSWMKQADGSFLYENRAAFDREAATHNSVERDGRAHFIASPWLGGGENARLCGGDAWTRDWFANRICRGLAERGCELVQVDQIVGASIPICWSHRHGHPVGDGAWRIASFRRQLADVVAAMRTAGVSAPVTGFEEPNELFVGTVGIEDYRDCQIPLARNASVFNYLYHEYLPCFQSNPQMNTRWLAHQVVDGQIPTWLPDRDEVRGGQPALFNGNFTRKNSDKGRPAEVGKPCGWSRLNGVAEWSPDDAYWRQERTTNGACLVVGSSPTGLVQIVQNVSADTGALPAGKKIRLSARLETVREGGPLTDVSFGICAYGPFRVLARNKLIPPKAGTGAQRVSADLTVPSGGMSLRITAEASRGGEIRVADMRLTEVQADGSDGDDVRLPAVVETPLSRFIRRWIELYRGEGRPFIAHGRHLKPPVVEAAVAADVFAAAYEAADDRQALVFANAADRRMDFGFTWRGKAKRLTLDPQEMKLIVLKSISRDK